MASRLALSGASETANVYVIRLVKAGPGNSLVTARRCDGDDCRARLDVRPGAFSPSFPSQTVEHDAGLAVVERSPCKY